MRYRRKDSYKFIRIDYKIVAIVILSVSTTLLGVYSAIISSEAKDQAEAIKQLKEDNIICEQQNEELWHYYYDEFQYYGVEEPEKVLPEV